ncbi:carboxypeptidase-like regulatory domain-containing protein [Microbacterium hydrothermale]|uniref:carboxypeptidase-like regulatory domain-containing protein n=1 Tax=Microbacterium hydrothermale TaxID=857427 RepID=UPI001F11488E|nr:carboxypeptidase-like regulatory domain-containing protein [Microbacterium hydrothermale]
MAPDGTYRIDGLTPGTYTVHFSARSDANLLEQWWDGKADADWSSGVTVQAGQAVTGIDASLQRGARVSGRVTFPAGTPSTWAQVVLHPSSDPHSSAGYATVDAAGDYTVSGLRAGEYTVEFQPGASALAPQWWKDQPTAATATGLTVKAAQSVSGVDATFRKGAVISGRVSVPTGSSAADASVQVFSAADPSAPVASGAITSDGTYAIPGLAAGAYKVFFTGSDVLRSRWYANAATFDTATTLTVAQGQVTSGIDATLTTKASIAGAVTLPAGIDPSAGSVTVRAFSLTDAATAAAQTTLRADGRYTLTGLSAGGYKILFEADGLPVVDEWWNDKTDYDAATVVVITDGQQKTGIDATLSPSSAITGRVILPDGVDLATGSVSVRAYTSSDAAAPVAETTAGVDGTYRLDGLAAGTYRVSFVPTGLPLLPRWWKDAASFEAAATVTVSAGAVASGVDTPLPRSATLSGTVALPSGITGFDGAVTVRAYSSESTVAATTTTSADGAYRLIGLPAGSYRLLFLPSGVSALSQWWKGQGSYATASVVTVTNGQDRGGLDVTLAPMASVQGKVTFPAGTANDQLSVTVFPVDQGTIPRGSAVAADGSYRVDGLEPGRYKVLFGVGSLPLVERWWDQKSSKDTATVLELTAGQQRTGVNAALSAAASISGKVDLPQGVSLGNGSVEVAVYPASSADSPIATTSVGPDGTYTVGGLRAGGYRVAFRGHDLPVLEQWWQKATAFSNATTVSLVAGQARTGIDATLSRSATITGRVILPSGVDLATGSATADIFVSTSSNAPLMSVPVRSDGTFRAVGLPAGSYKVRIDASGLPVADQWWKGAADFATATTVTLAAGATSSRLDIALARLASVSGKVTVPAGSAFGPDSVRVELYTISQERPVASATVSPNGGYRIDALAAGTYRARFIASNAPLVEQWWKNRPDFGTATLLTLGDGQSVTGVDAAMTTGASITGTVVLPTGYPLASNDVTVSVFTPRDLWTPVHSASVSADGTYRVAGLAPGSYRVRFSSGGSQLLDQWWKGATNGQSATTVTLAADQALHGIDAALSIASTVSGRVILPEGVSMSGGWISVNLSNVDGVSESGYAYVQQDGSWTARKMRPGTYLVSFSASNLPIASRWFWESTLDASSAKKLVVAAGKNRTGIDSAPPRGGDITGRITLPSGMTTSAAGLSVAAYTATGWSQWVADGVVKDDGSYAFVGLAPGDYKLQFRAQSTQVAPRWWKGQKSWASASPVTVVEGGRVSDVDESLPRSASVSGRVTLPAGVTLSSGSLTVEASSASGEDSGWFSTRVAADGTYVLAGLPAGDYRLTFRSYDLPVLQQWWNGATDAASATTLTLTEGQTRTNINATLEKAATIAGRVTLPAGITLGQGSISVSASPTTGSGWATSAQVRPDGTYAIRGLRAGSYKINFVPSGVPVLGEWWNDVRDFASATPVTVTTGQDRVGIDATLAQSATISGRVTLPATLRGRESRVSVSATSTSNQWQTVSSTSVNPDGTYTLTGIPAGSYAVKFSSWDLPISPEWWDDQTSFTTAKAVVVAAGAARTGIDATLALSATISGTVSLPASLSSSITSVRVSVTPVDQSWSTVASVSVRPDGTYTVTGLVPGDYKVKFSADNTPVLSEWWKDKPDFASATTITLSAAQNKTGIDAALARSSTISGRVTVPSGVSATAISVSAMSPNSEWSSIASTRAAADGSWTLNGLPAGSYKLRFTSSDAPVLDEWWDDATDFVSARTVAIAAGEDRTGITATLTRANSLSGAVTTTGGAAVGSATVTVYRAAADGSWEWGGSANADSSGAYAMKRLTPGRYKIAVQPPSGSGLLPEYYNDKPSLATATVITLGSGSSRDATANVSLATGTTVTGRVTYTDGTPVADTSVSLVSRSGDPRSWGTTDAKGAYSISGVAAGDLTAAVRVGGGTVYTGAVTTLAAAGFTRVGGASAKIDVRVPGVTVSGVVRSSVGSKPVSGGTVALSSPRTGYGSEVAVGTDGRYTVRGVTAGSWTAVYRAPSGGAYASTWFGGVYDDDRAAFFSVGSSAMTKDLTALPAGGTLSGTIAPMTGVSWPSITLYRWVDGRPVSTWTDNRGGGTTFRFEGLAPAEYSVSVNGIFAGGAVAAEKARRFDVAAGSSVDVGTVDAAPATTAGTIAVTVSSPSPSATRVLLLNAAGSEIAASTTVASSSSLTSTFFVPNGTYRAVASTSDAGRVQTWYGGASAASATKIVVTGGARKTASFALARGDGAVGGKVVAATDGRVVVGAAVRLTPLGDANSPVPGSADTWTWPVVYTGADGTFALPTSTIAGRSYRLDVAAARNGRVLLSKTFTAAVGTKSFTLSLPSAGSVTGAVVDPVGAGAVIGQSVVLWRDGDTSPTGWVQTDETGSYRFDGLAPGTYRVQMGEGEDGGSRVSALAPGWAAASRTREEATAVVVTAGKTVTVPTRTLERAGVLVGRVAALGRDSTTRWTDAFLSVKDAKGRVVAEAYSAHAAGGYSASIPAGTFTVCARPTDAGTGLAEVCRSGVTIAAGATSTSVDLTMRPNPKGSATVAPSARLLATAG